MPFICPVCGKSFGYSAAALNEHRNTNPECRPIMPELSRDSKVLKMINQFKEHTGGKGSMKKRKHSVNLYDLEDAVEDGRIDIWVNHNGEICLLNKKSKRFISIVPTLDMDGNPSDRNRE